MPTPDSQNLQNPDERDLFDLLVPFMNCSPAFADSAGDRCLERGLLPGHLLSCVRVLQFLSVTVLSAQRAHRAYGVRASVLLSMALDESGFNLRALARNSIVLREDDENTRTIAPEIDQWFNKRAKKLASKPFKVALRCLSTRRYIEYICDLGFGDSQKAGDLWANVESYELASCDFAGMLPVGKYSRWRYERVRNELGELVELKPWPLHSSGIANLSPNDTSNGTLSPERKRSLAKQIRQIFKAADQRKRA